jgi:DNA-binding transcriptional regulator YiaG
MLGVSAALARSWDYGQRKPAPIARRLLDLVHANPSDSRELAQAA